MCFYRKHITYDAGMEAHVPDWYGYSSCIGISEKASGITLETYHVFFFFKRGIRQLVMALIHERTQFHRLLALRENNELREILVGLWYRIWLGMEHLQPPCWTVWKFYKEGIFWFGTRWRESEDITLFHFISITIFSVFMSALDTNETRGF